MLAKYTKRTNIGVGFGVLTFLAGNVLTHANVSSHGHLGQLLKPVSSLLESIGAVLFLWGCWSDAKAKGYRGAWGLLGLLTLVGLIVLALFPDISDTAPGGATQAEAATSLGKPTSSRKVSWPRNYDFWAVVLSVLGLGALYLGFSACSFPIYLGALATEVVAMTVGFMGMRRPDTRLGAEVGLLVAVLVLLAGIFGIVLFFMCGGNLL